MLQLGASTELGLLPTEAVLRGGCLKRPILLTNLEVAHDKQWIRLATNHRDNQLGTYLCQEPSRKLTFAMSKVFGRIAALRDRNTTCLVTRSIEADRESKARASCDDKAALLELDSGDASPPPLKRSRKHLREEVARASDLVPRAIDVEMDTNAVGESWCFQVLTVVRKKSGHHAPAMELSVLNLQRLLQCVKWYAEASAGDLEIMMKAAVRGPRGPKKERE